MDRDIPIPQEVLDAEAPCDCGYPMSAHQDWRKKHDELAELVQDFVEVIELRGLSLPFCLYGHIAALRKAVEEK